MSDTGHGGVRLQTPKPVSESSTWEEILARIYDLDKRLNLLEQEKGIKPERIDTLPRENESVEDWIKRRTNKTVPLIPEDPQNSKLTTKDLTQLWRDCGRDPLRFAYKLKEEAQR